MYVARVIPTADLHPQEAIRGLLGGLLDAGFVDGVLVPDDAAQPPDLRLAATRLDLEGFDPLSPVMLANAARILPRALARGGGRMAITLHPCEARTAVEMAKRGAIDRERLLILGLDCGFAQAGPLPAGSQARETLRLQALSCASAGQPAPSEARLACRLCERPAADLESADILLGWIGLDPLDQLLMIADEEVDADLRLEQLSQRTATEREAVDREMALWRMTDRRKKSALELLEALGLADGHPAVAAGYLSRCTLCGECLDACALASDDLRHALQQGKTVFIQALLTEARRLASCSGCGFCQVNCPEDIPLCAIEYAIGHQVQSRIHYTPGRSLEDPLPWAS